MAIKSSVVSISTNLLIRFPQLDFYVNVANSVVVLCIKIMYHVDVKISVKTEFIGEIK